ncbi:hypothetical protein BU24DRAFT_417903 [Aaosphaeria arxii CBS 175.79]|uniref:Uncharacterized protein n=1 Tax=Aaosphaeria arxii CBS 175.79 TaxID=1450172 RepID=A0A6A5Y9K4_9PLEO|nr:uncharacterized protein BU24DRAFT_417903 [Aaosphaeria arxii CBS 175.79]KAF2022262.1 hypothetical protein BU24DRAFT_417903 [Aaosphaeria arxii CBS 175.79]
MADPEIELPRTASQLRLSHGNKRMSGITHPLYPDAGNTDTADISQQQTNNNSNALDSELELEGDDSTDKDESRDAGAPEKGVVEEEAEVVYRYLTFETELPSPTTIYPASDDDQEAACPPPPPDLAKYTSPFDWSDTRKNVIIWISCVITALTAYTAGSYSPGVEQMTEEWGVSSVAALVGITMFTTGMIGPDYTTISDWVFFFGLKGKKILTGDRFRCRADGARAVF